jgi:hypothetical protein
MKRLLIVLAVLALAAGAANATRPTEETAVINSADVSQNRVNVVFWFDDMEGGDNGWTHGDFTAVAGPPKFHVDTYMAYGGTGSSWWCGSFAYDADGGYGNSWYEYLNIPATAVSDGPTGMPILTFAYRYDSEATYDFTYIQAESLGVWQDLQSWDGFGAWTDIGPYGYLIDPYDNPFKARFLFTSDGAWSDADGNNTVGGGFACDNIQMYDFFSAQVFFFDDAETGGLCVPSHPGASGDYWHRRYDDCSSYSGHYSWWCGSDSDTALIPPLLQNWLDSPWINSTGYITCLLRSMMHFEVPTIDNDYLARWVTYDGVGYFQLNASWGDFGTCSGWSGSYWTTGKQLDIVYPPWPQAQVQISHAFYTTANGCGPGAGGGAGITIDNVQLEGEPYSPVESRSWGGIKALYR